MWTFAAEPKTRAAVWVAFPHASHFGRAAPERENGDRPPAASRKNAKKEARLDRCSRRARAWWKQPADPQLPRLRFHRLEPRALIRSASKVLLRTCIA